MARPHSMVLGLNKGHRMMKNVSKSRLSKHTKFVGHDLGVMWLDTFRAVSHEEATQGL